MPGAFRALVSRIRCVRHSRRNLTVHQMQVQAPPAALRAQDLVRLLAFQQPVQKRGRNLSAETSLAQRRSGAYALHRRPPTRARWWRPRSASGRTSPSLSLSAGGPPQRGSIQGCAMLSVPFAVISDDSSRDKIELNLRLAAYIVLSCPSSQLSNPRSVACCQGARRVAYAG